MVAAVLSSSLLHTTIFSHISLSGYRNAMCVQHKWPSANINNRRGKYTVRNIPLSLSSPLPLFSLTYPTSYSLLLGQFPSASFPFTSSLYSHPGSIVAILSFSLFLQPLSLLLPCIITTGESLPVRGILTRDVMPTNGWASTSLQRKRAEGTT